MKIICDNCRTKYSIADEKVKGKVFKIRCKKCQNIIVVRGNQAESEGQQPDDQAGGQGESKETPVWHLVIGRDQVGPMTVEEVRDRFAKGEIDAETYIWREGFSDWLRLTTVEDFADLDQATKVAPTDAAANFGASSEAVDFGAPTQEPQWPGDAGGGEAETPQDWGGAGDGAQGAWAGTQPRPAEMGASQDTNRSDPASLESPAPAPEAGVDLFASQTDGAAAEGMAPAAAPAQEPQQEAGLFQAPAGSPDPSMLSAPAGGGQQLFPQEEEDQDSIQMKGARHENSVLFSLSNLQALAMGGKPASPSAAAAAPVGGSELGGGEDAGVDGSGLIDIRSMASTPAPAGGGASSSAGADSLPDLGGYASPIAAAPVLMPTSTDERPKWLIPTIAGVGGTLVITVIVLVVFLVIQKPETKVVAVQTPVPVPPAGAPAVPKAAEKAPSTAGVTEKAAENVEAKAEEKSAAAAVKSKRRKGRSRRAARAGSSAPAPAAQPSERRSSRRSSKPKSKGDELDRLIDGAIDEKPTRSRSKRKPAAAAPDPNLPKTLSRGEIQSGMQRIKGRVQACYDKFRVPGMATAKVTISGAGRLSSAIIKGRFAATPTGACVRTAVMAARFPKFSGSPIKIEYPFVLR